MNAEKYKFYFNHHIRDVWWCKKTRQTEYGLSYGERWKRNLRAMILGYQKMLEVDPYCQATQDMPRTIAYKIAGTKGIPTKLVSKEASKKDEKIVLDHILGAKLIGEMCYLAWAEGGDSKTIDSANEFTADFLVDEWFYDNLWLWGTIGITKSEHDRLQGFDLSADEKLNLIHYKKAGIELDLKDGWDALPLSNKFFNI